MRCSVLRCWPPCPAPPRAAPPKVRKASAEELLCEKRLVLTAEFTGRVLSVSPPDSLLFKFPSLALVGSNLADCVDLFADWRLRSGESQMQLIILALLYKEQEMPGACLTAALRAFTAPA
jgi:hypothetical protein